LTHGPSAAAIRRRWEHRLAIAPDRDQDATGHPEPQSAAVTFVTTEHFVLQGARSATIAESNGRANMFLAAVSGALVALGLVATASRLGSAFYGFGLVLLPTLTFVGLVTFERTLQSSIEDTECARRIALLRGYYFRHAPEMASYLLSAPRAERLLMERVPGDRWQGYRTVAGMIAVITAVLAGSTAALAAILIFDHSLVAAVVSGIAVALPTMIALIRHQDSTWERAATEPLRPAED
jgi:F0F1-type ATP synthase assembly protein I